MPRTGVAVSDHGKSVTYEGVLLYDVLLMATRCRPRKGRSALWCRTRKKERARFACPERIEVIRLRP